MQESVTEYAGYKNPNRLKFLLGVLYSAEPRWPKERPLARAELYEFDPTLTKNIERYGKQLLIREGEKKFKGSLL